MDEFARSAVNFSKRIVKLEVQCKQLKDENNDLEEEVMDAKGRTEEMKEKYAKLKDKFGKRKEKFDSEERKWREEEEKLTEIRCQLERENKMLENNLRASAAEALRCVAKKLREVEAEAEAMKSLMEEKDAKITSLVKKNESLERFRSRSEIDSKAKEEKIVVLTQKIQVLEGEKGKLDAEFYKVKEDNEIKGRRICDLIKGEKMLTEYDAKITSLVKKNESLERFRSRLEIDSEAKEEKIVVLTQKIQVLEGEKGKLDAEFYKVKEDNEIKGRRICDLIREKEGEKMLIEYEGKKRVSVLNHRIEVLEREKKEVEDNFSLFVEKSEEINMIVNERPVIEAAKTTLEAESKKNVLELIQRIEVLEREKAELEAEVNQGKVGKKSKEITSILKKKHKEISNLVFRSDVLGSRKHRFDSQTRERDERIKVLMQEKERLVGTKKKMEIETNICVVKSKEDVELPQSMHLDASNVDIISTTTQNEGPEYTDVAAIEPQESSDGGLQSRGLLGSEIPKIVFEEGIGCSLAIQAGTKCCELDGLTEHNTLQHRLEVQTKEKDERIKMLVQEKECLVGKKKKIENEINRCNVNSKEDVELPQPVQADASNIDGTSSPTQNGGPEYIDVSDTEPMESSELLPAKITKRKVEVLGCSAAIQAAIKCCKLDGLTESKALQQRFEAQKEQEERIKMLVHENDSLVGEENKMENETNRCAVNSKEDVELPQRVHPDASNVDSTSTPTTQNGVSSPCPSTSTSSRYENQKWRDWNSFHKYLKNQKPDLTLSCCSGNHVREYLLYLDQFGKTIIHSTECPFYGHPSPSDPCPCPIRQGWGSLDALIGRLRAAFEEHGGKPENNPFGTEIVRRYLLHIKDSQSKARGVSYQKSRKNPRKAADSFMPPAPTPRKAVDSFMPPAPRPRRRTLPRRRAHSYMPPLPPPGPC